MDSDRPDELRKAVELMRGGDSGAARTLLIDHVMRNPGSELGWMLLSYVLVDRAQQVDCLERVLRINPQNEKARERLAELITPPPPMRAAAPPAVAAAGPAAAEETPATPPFVPEEEGAKDEAGPGPETTPRGDSALVSRLREVAEQTPLIEEEDEEEPLEGPIVWADRLPSEEAPTFEPAPAAPVPAAPPPARKGKKEKVQAEGSPPKKRRPLWLTILLIFVSSTLACAIIAVVVSVLVPGLLVQQLISAPTAVALPDGTPTLIPAAWTLPPKWTDTPTFTPTPTRTATPVPSATGTPAFATPDATTVVSMELIEKQVANLRGLSIGEKVPRYVISRNEAERVLSESFYAVSSVAEMADEARVLTALGLIKPTYDLVSYSLNRMADGVGGFYFPDSNELFVIGAGFTGVERFIYSHEFTHALVDQHYGLDRLGVYPECLGDEQRCDAIRALAEGDASLIMQKWLEEDATPQDILDLSRYRPQTFVVPEAFPPPFVEKDVNFPYEKGLAFVSYLHDRGSWSEVNRVYASLPASTEQILHPAKYIAGELPLTVSMPDLTSAVGAGWRVIKANSLGEWRTYLILGAGADTSAQLSDKQAAGAAGGWGGDQYLVYSDEQNEHLILVARWVWDTATDASDFRTALKSYLGKRFLGGVVKGAAADCWAVNEQAACMYSASGEILWVLAPDMEKITAVKAQFPTFK
ncbi:MAG TPA: hypothetical protein VJJ70_00860 [Anaerolineales bacterium]|nr:hypothetical protein [Anaerolineales bacterium]